MHCFQRGSGHSFRMFCASRKRLKTWNYIPHIPQKQLNWHSNQPAIRMTKQQKTISQLNEYKKRQNAAWRQTFPSTLRDSITGNVSDDHYHCMKCINEKLKMTEVWIKQLAATNTKILTYTTGQKFGIQNICNLFNKEYSKKVKYYCNLIRFLFKCTLKLCLLLSSVSHYHSNMLICFSVLLWLLIIGIQSLIIILIIICFFPAS